ncbi:hypothetical protein J0A68_21625, partial [Algoriphagus sp. H41]
LDRPDGTLETTNIYLLPSYRPDGTVFTDEPGQCRRHDSLVEIRHDILSECRRHDPIPAN